MRNRPMLALARKKNRLDQILVERGLAVSRTQAQALILAGMVLVDGTAVVKPGSLVPKDVTITVLPPKRHYVSRGGEKLAAALQHFHVEVADKVALDAGAATGGFTHCLLQHGARRVYAVDVGYGQLDPKLRQDPRVVLLERTNIRYLSPAAVPEQVQLVTLDLSFISLTLVLPKILELLEPGGIILALVKPQFEVGKGQVGKGGVVRDPALQQAAVAKITQAAINLGLHVEGPFPSPLKGPKGNQEYFLKLDSPG